MTRSDLVKKLMDLNLHLSKDDIDRIVSTMFDNIIETLTENGRVELRGFGTFGVKKIDQRKGRNPKTGEQVLIDSKSKPFFKIGKQLKEKLNA